MVELQSNSILNFTLNKKKNWYHFFLQMIRSQNNIENTSILNLVVNLGIRLNYFHQYICKTVTLMKVGEKLQNSILFSTNVMLEIAVSIWVLNTAWESDVNWLLFSQRLVENENHWLCLSQSRPKERCSCCHSLANFGVDRAAGLLFLQISKFQVTRKQAFLVAFAAALSNLQHVFAIHTGAQLVSRSL